MSELPDYAVSGTWTQNEDGTWTFSDGTRVYKSEWAAVFNPYANAAAGQSPYDWFYFDERGCMVTGWFMDVDGKKYYLNPESDGTQGRMVTGWKWIDGKECYFNEVSDGTKGALKEEDI